MYKYKLYIEKNGDIDLYGVYPTENTANEAVFEWCRDNGLKSYYWNCYTIPDGELAGGKHIDFGSYSTFFILQEVK